MKLFKQNDANGGLVLKQNQAGKALKQNYNFGRALYLGNNKSLTSSFRLNIPTLANNIDRFSILSFIKIINNLDITCWTPGTVSTNNTRLIMGNQYFIGGTDGGGNVLTFNPNNKQNTIGFSYFEFGFGAGSLLRCFTSNNNIIRESNNNYQVNAKLFSEIYFTSTFSGGGVQQVLIPCIYIFDRKLASNEILYIYNNFLGNEPLNIRGLIAQYKNNNAMIQNGEIVINDDSGNSHFLVFADLPAGTPEEKLIYANTNCFRTW